jgi:lipopolysaccharide export system permease protein
MPPYVLFRYLTMRTVFAVAALGAALSCLVLLVDLIENLRFIDKFKNGDFWTALSLSLLRTPALVLTMAPFIFLFGSIWLFTQLNRRAELAVMRSAGLSVWKLVSPPAFLAAFAGVLVITLFDPFATAMRAESEKMRDQLRGSSSSMMRVFGDGVWLRQRDAANILLINARSIDAAKGALSGVVMWRLDGDAKFIERIDAPEAKISGRTIELYKARIKEANERLDHRTPVYAIPTTLAANDLKERLESPDTLSLWRLPKFVMLAEAAGVPTTPYNIRFHDLCSTPLKLLAMVLIAALCSLRPVRSGGGFQLFLLAIGAGFSLYIISEVATALGESGTAPVALAAWTPAIVAALIAVAGLLQLEDG